MECGSWKNKLMKKWRTAAMLTYIKEHICNAEDSKGFIAGDRFLRVYKDNGKVLWIPMQNIRMIKFIPKDDEG